MKKNRRLSIKLDYALQLAEKFRDALQPHCEKVEIAGSVSRRESFVSDIEIVCLATMTEKVVLDMFKEEIGRETINTTFLALPTIMESTGWEIGKLDGARFKKLVRPISGIKLDLFVVDEARRWGAAFLIRTGPKEFNIELMKYINRHGQHVKNNLLHDHVKIWEKLPGGGYKGIACEKGDTCPLIIPTPTEEMFFDAVGLPHVSADLRSVDWLKQAVSNIILDKAKRMASAHE